MRLLYPLGLLALIAIPLLVIIYIIKSKYTEQVIGSTYLWELSERFLKRKNPISRVTGIISLILQIFAVVLIALAISHPVFILKGQAEDYCFIIDCSGSMNMTEDGHSRFERAIDYASDVIQNSKTGSTYTIIIAGDGTDVSRFAASSKDADNAEYREKKLDAIKMLEGVRCSYADNDLSKALSSAQEFFRDNPAGKIYLLTDKTVITSQNIEVVNFGGGTKNYALSEASYAFFTDGIKVTATATSYGEDAQITVQAFEDDAHAPAAYQQLSLTANEAQQFTLQWENPDFTSLRIVIAEEDALSTDSEIYLYNLMHDSSYKTLVVSDSPFFIQTALTVLGNVNPEVVSKEEYDRSMESGYGLYVYEDFAPEKIPSDGAVWFINPPSTSSNSGFSVNGTEELDRAGTLQYNKSTASAVKKMLKGVELTEEISLKSYVRCNTFRGFTVLASCEGNPVIFAGTNNYDNKQVVFALDVKWSDFTLSYNYVVLMNNLLSYTFPSIIDQTLYTCGDTFQVNLPSGSGINKDVSVRVSAPSGNYEYLDSSSGSCILSEAGEYTVTVTIGNDVREINIFSQLNESERAPVSTMAEARIEGQPGGEKRSGRYEDILYLFIILAVIVVADWGLYCYDQYQLR